MQLYATTMRLVTLVVRLVYGSNPFASKKDILATNVKVSQPLPVAKKRFPLYVTGFLNFAGI